MQPPALEVSVAVGSLTISKIVPGGDKDGGGYTFDDIKDDGGYVFEPIKGGMGALPGLFSGEISGEIDGKYGGTVTDKGSVYDVIKITKGTKSFDVAHTGYSKYTAVNVLVPSC